MHIFKIQKAKSFFGFAFFCVGIFMSRAAVFHGIIPCVAHLYNDNFEQQKSNLCHIT